MKKRVLLISSGVIVLLVIASVIILNISNKSSFISREDSPKTYLLENATDNDIFERMISITLYSNGTAELPQPVISSYMLSDCKYDVVNGELIIYTSSIDEPLAIFTIEDNNMLIFKSTTVPIRADIGARYIYEPIRLPNVSQITVSHILGGNENVVTLDTPSEIEQLEEWLNNLRLELKNFDEENSPGNQNGGELFIFRTDSEELFSYVNHGANYYIVYGEQWYEIADKPLDPIPTK